VALVGHGQMLQVVRAGQLRGPDPVGVIGDEAATSSVWVDTSEGAVRLVPRLPVSVGPPSLLETPAGRRLVAFGPGGGPQPLTGITVARADASPEEQAVLARLHPPQSVAAVALGSVYGSGDQERLLLAYTTDDPATVGLFDLAATPGAAAPPMAPVTLPVALPGVSPTDGGSGGGGEAPPAAGGGPSLIPLAEGVIGLSYCYAAGAEVHRLLVPLDLAGQPLGPPLDLGVQAPATSLPQGEARGPAAVRCPTATLVWHGPRLLSSSAEEGQVVVDEVRCTERRRTWPQTR
jgi:hypothetical protein